MMIHYYGPVRKIISFHAEVPADINIGKAHDVIDKIEQDIFEKYNCITTIHMDPIVVDDEEINSMKKTTEEIVKSINQEFSIHDFRMTDGGERINLIFDLVLPREGEFNKEQIRKEVQEKIHKINILRIINILLYLFVQIQIFKDCFHFFFCFCFVVSDS